MQDLYSNEYGEMFAKNLEALLTRLSFRNDMSSPSEADGFERFESLRSYRLLPQGREHRAKTLTNEEIAAAILGLVPPNPKWAGHSALILSDLRPVGGVGGSFEKAATLRDAITSVVSNQSARQSLVRLQVSGAERFTNSSGSATLLYESRGTRRRAYFVSKMAISLGGPGAEKSFDPDRLHSQMSREVSFTREFFDELVHSIEIARAVGRHPDGDGSEYDAEEARQARHKKLGVWSGSNFLNIGVDNQVTWPTEETVVKFDQYTLVLMPRTKDCAPSVHIDLTANRLTDVEALTIINRYLSIMMWCTDGYAIAQDGWSGGPVPNGVPLRSLGFATSYHWIFDRKISEQSHVRRALALYREARNAQQNFMVSYAVLNYYKIIELKYEGKGAVRNWFRDKFELVKEEQVSGESFDRFAALCMTERPHEYIYKACRVAVAHAGKQSRSDPDEVPELHRLHVAADVLHKFARYFIKSEFGVSDLMYSGD